MDNITKISPHEVIVKDRARKEFPDLSALKESIQTVGLINPISVNDKYELLAGECRLRAVKELKHELIPVRIFKNISPTEERLIEYFENVARNSFTWHEEIMFKKRLHDEWTSAQEDWSIRKTATKLNCSAGGLSSDLDLAKGIEYFPTLVELKTKKKSREAYKKILSRAKAQHIIETMDSEDKAKLKSLFGDAIPEEVTIPSESNQVVRKASQGNGAKKGKFAGGVSRPKPLRIVHENGATNDDTGTTEDTPYDGTDTEQEAASTPIKKLQYTYKTCSYADLLEELPDNFLGFAELDPPYAIDYNYMYSQANKEATESDWTVSEYRSHMNTLLKTLYSKMMADTFVLIWTGVEHFMWLNTLAEECGFSVQKPGIWVKPGGSSNTPSTTMVSNYEMFIVLRKGHPTFNAPSMKATVEFPTVPFSQRSHQWEKPMEMYRYFIKLLGMRGHHMFSGFAGSGSAMIAALHEEMIPIGCDLKTQYYYSFMERLNKEFGNAL